MSNLIIASQNLPANIEELAKFVLVGRQKLNSVRAEIKAIDYLPLAEEVRTQKREEAMMLSEALLDAEVRIGELTRVLPKDTGFKGNQWSCDTGVVSAKPENAIQKPKLEVIKNLGFNPKQVERFETLANNPDIVDQVKAEARENDDLPTRSRVLQLVKEKNKPVEKPAICRREILEIHNAITKASTISPEPEKLMAWLETLTEDEEINFNLMMVDDAIANLQIIKAFITKNRRGKS